MRGADPYLGTPGKLATVSESRIEFVAERRLRAEIQEAVTTAHPYEEPSYDILESYAPAPGSNLADAPGLGRIGTLAQPLPLRDFVEIVLEALPPTVWGVRAAGTPPQQLKPLPYVEVLEEVFSMTYAQREWTAT